MNEQQPARFVDDDQRYRLDSRIATGGMGEVWRATDTVLGRPVAVKVLKNEYADDATFRQRFATEAQHAASLHHPGVAGVYDVGESRRGGEADGSGTPRPYLVMELVEGEPLSALLKQARDDGEILDRAAVRDLLAQAGDALGAAHAAGIVHRDVKPANLLVTPDGRLKITDFGIARAAHTAGLTQTGTVMGTPQYISPEQAQGEPATARSDVYSLGVVAFECLAGRRPFDAESPVATALAHVRDPVPALPPDVPGDLAAVVQRALAKDAAERYADGSQFAAALRDPATAAMAAPAAAAAATRVLGAGVPVPTSQAAAAATDDDRRRRRSWLAVLATLLVVALLVLLVVWLSAGDDDEEPVEAETSAPTSETSEPPPTTPPTQATPDDSVEVVESDYVGRPVDEVAAALRELGLRVQLDEIDNPGSGNEGLVEGVDPSGTLSRGETVTVRYWGPPPAEPTEEPTEEPTQEPTDEPTGEPTGEPTESSGEVELPTETPTSDGAT